MIAAAFLVLVFLFYAAPRASGAAVGWIFLAAVSAMVASLFKTKGR